MTSVELLYLSGFVAAAIIRKYYTVKFKPEKERVKQSSAADRFSQGLMGISLLSPVLKICIDHYTSKIGLQWPWAAVHGLHQNDKPTLCKIINGIC